MTEYICKEVQTDNGGYLEPVKELIRCKGCKYWQLEHYVGGEGMACQFLPCDDINLTESTDFCSWAERKEE